MKSMYFWKPRKLKSTNNFQELFTSRHWISIVTDLALSSFDIGVSSVWREMLNKCKFDQVKIELGKTENLGFSLFLAIIVLYGDVSSLPVLTFPERKSDKTLK